MKKTLLLLVLCCGLMVPIVSRSEFPNSAYYPRKSIDYDQIKWNIGPEDLLNLTSDTGTIVWNTFRISVFNLSNVATKLSSFFCGVGGTFDKDFWYSDTCYKKNKQILKLYEDSKFMYHNYGDKKTFVHNILLDVPSLIVNLSEM